MNPQDRLQWVQDAVSALDGIRPEEVASVMMEVQRSVTRHNQIVPKICDLVHAKRAKSSLSTTPSPYAAELRITNEAQKRRAAAKTQADIEDAWAWERNARIDAKLAVAPIQKPLGQSEIERMPAHVVKFGLQSGFLKRDGSSIVEVNDPGETDRIRKS